MNAAKALTDITRGTIPKPCSMRIRQMPSASVALRTLWMSEYSSSRIPTDFPLLSQRVRRFRTWWQDVAGHDRTDRDNNKFRVSSHPASSRSPKGPYTICQGPYTNAIIYLSLMFFFILPFHTPSKQSHLPAQTGWRVFAALHL